MDYIVSNTAISRENIEQQFQVFITNHPDGKISKKSFKTMMKACYPGANVDKLTKHIWRMYDDNNDGYIDFRELMMVSRTEGEERWRCNIVLCCRCFI